MGTFESAYRAWREAPFPGGSSNDKVDELRAELILADTWLADTLIPFVEEGRRWEDTSDISERLDRIFAEAEEHMGALAVADREKLLLYCGYASLMRRAITGYTEVLRSLPDKPTS